MNSKNISFISERKTSSLFITLFLSVISIVPLGSEPVFYGWEVSGNYSSLFINGKKLFQSNEPFIFSDIPEESLVDFSLMLGEYYIAKLEQEPFFKLIQLIQERKENYNFLENILLFFWYQENAQSKEAEKRLKKLLEISSDDPYLKNLSEKVVLFLDTQPNKKMKLNYDDIKSLTCARSKNYYSICRIVKLRTLLEIIQQSSFNLDTNFANLDRLLASFFEEDELEYIPFLDKWIPDFPAKLSAMGFAEEAIHFQRMLIKNENVLGKFDVSSYEKLASYQFFASHWNEAENSLEIAIKSMRSMTVMKNSLLLKIGLLNYLKKDYSKALNYLVQLNFKYWGRTIKNPLTDEPLSVNGARELIALVLWKAKSSSTAVKALSELKKSFPTEEGLFIRLRIAQIIFSNKPQLAEKMTEEIIYIAQSKGWKRVEYAATLLNGFINIVNKKQRKAVVQFTKSFGILGNNDPTFTNEWVRQSGMIRARISGKERGNHSSVLKKLTTQIRNNFLSTDAFQIKLYIDSRFGIEEFNKLAIDYFLSTKDYESLLELLYYISSENTKRPFQEQGSLQVPSVNSLIKFYGGFKAAVDNVYYKGVYGKYREEYASLLKKHNDSFNIQLVKNASIPVLFLLPYDEKIYSIGYNPESNEKSKWSVNNFSIKDYQTVTYYNKLISLYPFLVRDSSYQLFLNQAGLDLHQILHRQKVAGFGYLFFGVDRDFLIKKSQPVHLNCNPQIANSNPISLEQAEGSKALSYSTITFIWNFNEVSNKAFHPQQTYQWKCRSGESLEFRKLIRRMDSLTLPNSLYFSNPLLHNINPYFSNQELLWFLDFWFRKGVSQIVYVNKLENDLSSEIVLRLLTNPSTLPEEWKKVQTIWKNSETEGIILWREIK